VGELLFFPARPLQDQLLTKPELAARWKVSPRWIEDRVRYDGLPKQKDPVSRLVRFSLVDVECWRRGRLAS
jgi:hypothetical protein